MFMRRWFNSKYQREQSLWSFLSRQLYKKNTDQSARKQVNDKRRLIFTLASVSALAVILFIVLEPSFAQAPVANVGSVSKTIINWAIGGIAKVVVWLAEQLGYVLIFLIELLINVVQYNNFVNATPVQIGWPLLRDTVNMFFIVVVLVTAFATIIGYPADFNYKKVLPKLLLMAVLINFSKTLIGLMIDFSQVIVLTFVNGFKQAAGGNFIQALGISKIMRLTDTTGMIEDNNGEITITLSGGRGEKENTWSLMNIFVAAVFAIWIVSLSITLILIMLIFFLARIIVLWFLLITSPVAFFAWSLPGTLQSAFKSFTGEWWSKLSAALVGGPTMAFFLWLSLAMAQRSTDLVGPTGLYDPEKVSTEVTQFQQTTKQQKFVTPSEFGDPRVFATFIIMVAFMLVGVQTSVKFASDVAPAAKGLLNFLEKSKAGVALPASLMAGRFAAKTAKRSAALTGAAIVGGAGLAYGGAKLAGKGAMFAGKEYEARTGKISDLAKGAQKSKYFAWAPVSVQKAVSGVAAAPKKAAIAKAKQLKDIGSDMDPIAYQEMLATQLAAANGSIVPGRDKHIIAPRIGDVKGIELAMAQQAMSGIYQESLNKANEGKAREQLGKNATEDQVKARAKEMTNTQVSQQLAQAEKYAKEHNDDDMLKKIKEMREKNPALALAGDKRREQAINDASDTQGERRIKPEAFMDGTYALNYAHKKGWIDERGRKTATADTDPEYKKFMGGKQGDLMRAHLEYARSSEAAGDQVQAIITGKHADGSAFNDVPKDAAGNVIKDAKGDPLEGEALRSAQLAARNYTVNVSKDGEGFSVVQNQNFRAGDMKLGEVKLTSEGRFDRTTNDENKIVRNDATRQSLNANMGQLGMVQDSPDEAARPIAVQDIGKEISQDVAEDLNRDLGALQQFRARGAGRSGGINLDEHDDDIAEERAKMARKYLQHSVSTKALFGHDGKTGGFANEEGRKAFEKTMEGLVDKIQAGDYGQETVSALSALTKQVGNKGEAYELMQQSLSRMNQGQILNAMNAGIPEQKTAMRKAFMTVVSQAEIDKDSGKSGTAAMRFREAAIKPPPPGSPPEDFKRSSAVHRILFEGK
jgi:hypothetical protein